MILQLSAADLSIQSVQDDLADLSAFLETAVTTNTSPLFGGFFSTSTANSDAFTFSSFGLSVSEVEEFTIEIEGSPYVANPDFLTMSEDQGPKFFDSMFANDELSLGLASVQASASTKKPGFDKFEVFEDLGRVSFDPREDFNQLAVGETDTFVFNYTVEGAFNARSTTTGTIEIEGRNDAPRVMQSNLFKAFPSLPVLAPRVRVDDPDDRVETLLVELDDSLRTASVIQKNSFGEPAFEYDATELIASLEPDQIFVDQFT